ncbi:hypothetical protein [Pseudodesulfovibrio indicus]|nr:hypothetical protein [Pseudodesulfovibrio indicus]
MVCKRRGMRTMLAGLLALGLLLTPALAAAYGGGGGGGGAFESDTSKPQMDPWTRAEVAEIFKDLSPAEHNTMVEAFSGSTISKRDLLTVRQVFLEQYSNEAQSEAEMLDACVKTLEILDKMGEISQEGLSFVPGVGWVTSVTLGAARGGANAYRDGLSGADIAKGIVIGGGASALAGQMSAIDANKAFNTAKAGINLARNAVSQQVKTRAVGVVTRAMGRYGIGKAMDYGTEKGLSKAMEKLADYVSAPNMAQQPSFTPDPAYDPMSSAPASPIAGGTPQL